MRSPLSGLAGFVCLAALLGPCPVVASGSFSPLQWLLQDDSAPPQPQEQLLATDDAWSLQEADRQLGDELMAEKRALSALSRWKPFSDTFRSSGRPVRGHPDQLSRTVQVETRGRVRPVGQPLRWGRR